MDQRQVRALQKRVHKHAKHTCASHTGDDGCLETMHGRCVLSFSAERVTANVCPVFMKSVGPSEPGLFDAYLDEFPDGYPLKPNKTEFPDKCTRCYQRYKKASNRQKYCDRCKPIVKQEQAKQRMAKKRLSDATKHLN